MKTIVMGDHVVTVSDTPTWVKEVIEKQPECTYRIGVLNLACQVEPATPIEEDFNPWTDREYAL